MGRNRRRAVPEFRITRTFAARTDFAVRPYALFLARIGSIPFMYRAERVARILEDFFGLIR